MRDKKGSQGILNISQPGKVYYIRNINIPSQGRQIEQRPVTHTGLETQTRNFKNTNRSGKTGIDPVGRCTSFLHVYSVWKQVGTVGQRMITWNVIILLSKGRC